ncbi:hypothetical protein LPJ79_003109 [Coemansia sp. RSA 1821]|nr:hypothetical protein LPJ79_003109 [Coemansia sp. RSA 1821]
MDIRPSSYIGIHSSDSSTKVLYVTEGVLHAVGYAPSFLVNKQAKDFIADSMDQDDYPLLYASSNEDGTDNTASVYSMWVNIKSARGMPVLHRIVSFRCDHTVIYLGITFPQVPFKDHHELEVEQLDREAKRLNVTRTKNALEQSRPSGQMFVTRGQQAKCAVVLEHYAPSISNRQVTGPCIRFATSSIDRVLDADYSDLIGFPFLKLVAPEDVLLVTKFLDRLVDSCDVQFEKFCLLSRPYVISGDIVVPDCENVRVLVEALGAASSSDGMVLLLRKIRSISPPTPGTMHQYLHARSGSEEEMSLLEILTSDPETSCAAPGWSLAR